MVPRSLARPLVMLGIVVALAACGGTATPPPAGGGGSSSPAPSVAGSTASPAAGSTAPSTAGGGTAFEGSFQSSGLYSATWTVAPDMPPNPFNSVNNPTLTSDKGTFGNIKVNPDGSVAFGSGGTGFSGSYKGTGAKVTLDASGQFVCSFTADIDLTGTNDKKVLHISGSMKVHWQLLEGGGQTCP